MRTWRAAYYATITHIDHEIGKLMAYLESTGQRENTLIIFHADHGEMLGDQRLTRKGSMMYDPVTRIPLILSMPGALPQNRIISDTFVELVDLAPTIYELAGIQIPDRVQGKSLMPLLENQTDTHRNGVYSEYYNGNPSQKSYGNPVYITMWRERNWKICVNHGEDLGELYNLHKDPQETVNLWNDTGHSEIKTEMLKKCFDTSVFTMDPMPPRIQPF